MNELSKVPAVNFCVWNLALLVHLNQIYPGLGRHIIECLPPSGIKLFSVVEFPSEMGI